MTKTVTGLCVCLCLLGCEPADDVGRARSAVIVGEDDRTDWYEADAIWRARAADSIAAVVPSERLTVNGDGSVDLSTYSLQELVEGGELCDDVRYLDQRSLATCSATLVGEQLMLTASHCIAGADCSGFSFVFDYYLTDPSTLAEIDAEDVYTCTRVVTGENESGGDFVFLELDRPVTDARRPVPLADEPPADGERLHMLGFPLGVPLKVTPGEVVQSVEYWQPLIDSFGGNSGSSLRSDDGRIRGILTGTAGSFASFIETDAGCYTENRYPEDRSNVPAYATPSEHMLEALCEDAEWTGAPCAESPPVQLDAGPADAGFDPGPVATDAGGDPGAADAGVGPAPMPPPSMAGCSAAPGGSAPAALLIAAIACLTARRRPRRR